MHVSLSDGYVSLTKVSDMRRSFVVIYSGLPQALENLENLEVFPVRKFKILPKGLEFVGERRKIQKICSERTQII